MSLTLNRIEKESLQLPLEDRAILAEHLLESLDLESDKDVNSEKEWIEEAEKRYQAYRAGKIKGKSADLVFEEAYDKFK
ncbi:MAG: addiction module protein [Thermodesulfobacteriota bacterium]